MRKEIMGDDLDDVVGGTVVVSDKGAVAFTTVREKYKLNVDWLTARNEAERMLDENPDMGDAEFDQLVKNAFIDAGYITIG